jgi:hypothetical protein
MLVRIAANQGGSPTDATNFPKKPTVIAAALGSIVMVNRTYDQARISTKGIDNVRNILNADPARRSRRLSRRGHIRPAFHAFDCSGRRGRRFAQPAVEQRSFVDGYD